MNTPPRYVPLRSFPPYRFLPVRGGHPHPEKEGGYSFNGKHALSAPLKRDTLAVHPDYLHSLDLFNHRYHWEAHVRLEALWNGLGRKGDAADFLKALIKICAAWVKKETGNPQAAGNHLARALELSQNLPALFLGMDIPSLRNALAGGTCPDALRIQEESLSLGGGCFWGVEGALSLLTGVLQTTCGYQGGHTDTPSYERVCQGDTGHAEVVLVRFAPPVLPLERLLKAFLFIHDPTQHNRQGADVGSQYRSAVFCQSQGQLSRVRKFLEGAAGGYPRPLETQTTVDTRFAPAEEGHQMYLSKNPGGYCHISPGVFRRIREGQF